MRRKQYFFPDRMRIEWRTHPSPGGYAPVPPNEDGAWLQVETIVHPEDGPRQVVTVNQVEKARIIQERLDNQLAKDEAQQAEDQLRQVIKNKARQFQRQDVVSLESIKDEIEKIYSILKHMTRRF